MESNGIYVLGAETRKENKKEKWCEGCSKGKGCKGDPEAAEDVNWYYLPHPKMCTRGMRILARYLAEQGDSTLWHSHPYSKR